MSTASLTALLPPEMTELPFETASVTYDWLNRWSLWAMVIGRQVVQFTRSSKFSDSRRLSMRLGGISNPKHSGKNE
jgi:hypothetical protein